MLRYGCVCDVVEELLSYSSEERRPLRVPFPSFRPFPALPRCRSSRLPPPGAEDGRGAGLPGACSLGPGRGEAALTDLIKNLLSALLISDLNSILSRLSTGSTGFCFQKEPIYRGGPAEHSCLCSRETVVGEPLRGPWALRPCPRFPKTHSPLTMPKIADDPLVYP